MMLLAGNQLPRFISPYSIPLHDLGLPHNRTELQRQLNKFGDFSVIDARSDNHVKSITIRIDSEGDQRNDCRLCHYMVGHLGNENNGDQLSTLLSLGVDPNVTDVGGNQPLHFCAKNGRWKIAQLLLDCRASWSAKDNQGQTLLARVRLSDTQSNSFAILGVSYCPYYLALKF
jgi:ankyrin repeat protein